MNEDVTTILARMAGEPCCRKHVGRMGSLSLGFGEPQPFGPNDAYVYRKWELGTYCCAWRVVENGKILCGSQEPYSIDELDARINQFDLGRFVRLQQFTPLDVRVELDNGLFVDFLATLGYDTEGFHVFCPDDMYIEFSVLKGWRIGPSNQPWV